MKSPWPQGRGRVEFIGLSALFLSLLISWRNITTLEVMIVSLVRQEDVVVDQEKERISSLTMSNQVNATPEKMSINQTSAPPFTLSGDDLGNKTVQRKNDLPDKIHPSKKTKSGGKPFQHAWPPFNMTISTTIINKTTTVINISRTHERNQTYRTKKELPRKAYQQHDRSHSIGTEVVHNLSNNTRPPLDKLLHGWNIIGDVQFLLHFAIMGHAKCGTSTLMEWFGHHSRIQIFPYEVQHMSTRKPARLVRKIYTELKAGPQYRYGYKNPTDVEHKHIFQYLNRWFPKTGIFIGVRHPVLWFESFYNFRVQNWKSMPNATALIGRCTKEKKMTCTYRANFHHNLFGMRKTSMTDDFLNRLLKPVAKQRLLVDRPVRNPVFLFDTAQLADQNETRKHIFRKDVQAFLGLNKAMPPIPHNKPGKKAHNAAIQKEKDNRKIDICRSEYDGLRKALMLSAREASSWIRLHFMEAQDVFISSPQYFQEILMKWMQDPCDERKKYV